MLLGVETLAAKHWIAALLTAIAIFLLGWKSHHRVSGMTAWLAAGLALVSCMFFGGVDTVVGHAGQAFGTIPMLVTAAASFALLSSLLLPLALREKPAPQGRPAMICGNLAYGVQAVLLNVANAVLATPTIINIVYSSRGLFGITHTWFLGHRFGNFERQEVGDAMMLRRWAGAALLMIAIMLVVLS